VGGDYYLGQETLTNWTGITYTPEWFMVRVKTTGILNYPPDSTDESVCIDLLVYLNAECACNGTWAVDADRTIVKALCPPDSCNDTRMVFDDRILYGNAQIQQNATHKFLLLTETRLNQTDGFNQTDVDFAQTTVCGRGCKSCSVPPGSTLGFNCTECCAQHAEPIYSPTASNCQCMRSYRNDASDNFTLHCISAAPASRSSSILVFAVIVVLSLIL